MTRARRIAHLTLGLWILSLLTVSIAWAKPTTSEQARSVVANWLILAKKPLDASLGQQVKDIQTFADASGPLYFVVYLEPAGLVFVPGDDLVEPIIGFAAAAKVYDPTDANPLWSLANRDIPSRVFQVREQEAQAVVQGAEFMPSTEAQKAQRKWTALQQGQNPQDLLGEGLELGLPTIDDIYVAPLIQSAWNQGTVDNSAATPHCYDFYTHWGVPDTYFPCGCVATAMAQVMRKWQHPASGVSPAAFPITYTIGATQFPINEPLQRGTLAGGAYDWANMPLNPLAGINDYQRQVIGALTHDAGATVNMNYAVNGSGTDTLLAADAFKNVFMYSNAKKGADPRVISQLLAYNIPSLQLFAMVNPNLDAGHPVLFGITGTPGGHAIVGDGYGNHWGTWYHHLNMGWANARNSDAWYNLPDINPPQMTFNTLHKCVYNIFVTGSGEIISGRVTDSCGRPVAGVIVTASGPGNPPAATTDARGIYAFPKVAANATYTIHASGTGYTDQTVTTGESVDNTLGCGNRWAVNFVANRTPAVTNPEYVVYNLGGTVNSASQTLEIKASNAYAINSQGVIAGAMKIVNSYLNYNPCMWWESPKGKFTFKRWDRDAVDYGELHGINDNNLCAGWAYKAITGQNVDINPIYIEQVGDTLNLHNLTIPSAGLGGMVPTGRAFGVNDNGVIVGAAVFAQNDYAPCSWPTLTSMAQRIGTLGGTAGTDQTRANRINNAGWIVGMNYNKAFLWNGSSVTWLGPAGGNGEGCGLNSLNPPTVVGLTGTTGYVNTRAVIFNGSAVTELSSTDGGAYGVNDQRQIVGSAQFGGRSHAFIYDQATGTRDLNTLVNEPDWELISANDINGNGEIVGWGWYGEGHCWNVPMAFLARPLYTITASAGAGGVISPSGAAKVVRGDSLTFAIIPDAGFQIANVVVDGVSQGAIVGYTFINVASNHTISATFTAGATHTITASAGSGGSIDPAGAVTVNHGANQTFTITPLPGFRIAAVMVDGVSQGAIGSYTFTNVTADHTISASFVVLTYTITASAGTGGSITPSGAVTVNYGDSKTFNISANSGYQITDVVVDGTTHLGAVTTFTFTSVTADHTIAASFTPITVTYTIAASAGSGGSITPSGSVTVNSGGSRTFNITANSGYQIANVVVDSVSQGAISSYTFSNVTANHSIAATFTAVGTTYTITASAGTGGTISPSGAVTVTSGGSRTFTITANSGYRVNDVKVDNVSQGAITSYTFSNVTANHTISATFVVNTGAYTISASTGSGGSISPSGAVQVNAGANLTFTLTCNTGYVINNVLVDGSAVGNVATYTFTNVSANHTISASFKKSGSCGAFFDHFDGSSLGASWIVKNPNPAFYAVSNSRLHTQTLPGDLWGGATDYQNLFLIQNPAAYCDFQVTIKVLGFHPVDYFQQIGVIAYDDDDNYVMSSNIYADGQAWELAKETNGTIEYSDDPIDAGKSDFYLRLVKVGNTYRQFFSLDGVTYQERNQAITYGNGAPKYLGFIALEGSGIEAPPVPVDIDFFAVDSLNTPGKNAIPAYLNLLLGD